MFRKATSTRAKVVGVSILAVFVLAIYLAITAIDGVPLVGYHYVDAVFADPGNLAPHSDVRIAGARIGQVSSISQRGSDAVVRMQLQPNVRVYRDATAGVGAVSVLGEEYVTLNPGTAGSGPLQGGISAAHTTPPVEIDQILNILKPAEANAAAATIQTLGAGFGGQQDNIRSILSGSPTFLPNLGTTTATLADPSTGLVPLLQASNLLASRFTGRQAQISQLVSQMATTFAALDTGDGRAIESAIAQAAPTLPPLTSALTTLEGAASDTREAVTDLRPGLSALGAGTPDLRGLLRDGVAPLDQVPGVATESLPGLSGFTTTLQTARAALVPLLTQLEVAANPLVTYLEPYAGDMTSLYNNLFSALSTQGDQNGTMLRLAPPFGASGLSFSTALYCHNAYPAPGQASTQAGSPTTGGCK